MCPKMRGVQRVLLCRQLTCHDDGLPEAQQHEGQSRCCVGHGVRAMHDQKGVVLLPAAGQVSSGCHADRAAETHQMSCL